MKIQLNWHAPLPLVATKPPAYECDLEAIPATPGIYIFARRFGKTFEYLYIGETGNMQSRVRGHLNNLKLMSHIKDARNGGRYLLFAEVIHHMKVQPKIALRIAERALIDFALFEQHRLLNKQGTRRQVNTIQSNFPTGYKKTKTLGVPKVMDKEAR